VTPFHGEILINPVALAVIIRLACITPHEIDEFFGGSMTNQGKNRQIGGFLKRLRSDTAGNTIALMAAAVVPTIGLVGGGLDMSRLYLVETRIQAACDAGALMGRRVMGAGAWADNNYKAKTEAERIFAMNFATGSYGSSTLTRTFSESAGNVTGVVTAKVPMSLMAVFGQADQTISANCTSEMRIPDSDVMFVLDTTGSMDDGAISSQSISSSNPRKIDGLKVAVKCFYETLTQKNITDTTAAQCGETADPVYSASNASVIRFGFVPYTINVNVGRLLPLSYMADTWSYQTRVAKWVDGSVQVPTEGTPGAPVYGTETTSSPSTGSWTDSGQVNIGGTTYLSQVKKGKGGFDCLATFGGSLVLSPPPTQTTGPTTAGPNKVAPDPATPVYPQATIRYNYLTTVTSGTVAYRYRPYTTPVSLNSKCILQSQTTSTVVSKPYYADSPLTWAVQKVFTGWDYKKATVDVSGLKDTNNNAWQNSLTLPLKDMSATSTQSDANVSIPWDGCILERKAELSESNWDTALDLDLETVPTPSNPDTYWGPRLPGVLYERHTLDSNQNPTTSNSTRTQNPIFVAAGKNNQPRPDAYGDVNLGNCPRPAKIYQTWDSGAFQTEVNALSADGYTFHDIGLLWGGRLMSTNGIFASNNGGASSIIQRHMIFMTDGDTNTPEEAFSAYNYPWYDRLQTDAANPPTWNELVTITDKRTAILCTKIKNLTSTGVTLWVVAFGDGVNAATSARLAACASPGKYFAATSSAALMQKFKDIAAEISALRLTS
jgi:Flp pilus assembly protein TadG